MRFQPSTGVRAALLILLLACLPAVAAAQEGSMELTVLDPGGDPVQNATVEAIPEGGGDVVVSETTNRKGVVKAEFPAAGFYLLTIRAEGFPDREGRVEIREGMTNALSIKLLDQETMTQQQAVDAFNAGVAIVQNQGDEDEALANFQRAAELNPQLADAHRLVALISANTDDLDRTRSAVEAFLEVQPGNVAAVAPAAYQVYRADGNEAGLEQARAALAGTPFASDTAVKVFNEGVKELQDGNEDAARALFEEAILVHPELSAGHRSLAALEFNAGNYEAAVPHLERLLEITPGHRDGSRMAFFAYSQLGRSEEALAAGRDWAAKDDNASEEISAAAVEYFENNEFDKARGLMELALEVAPDSAYAHYTMGRVMAGAGDIGQARTHLQRFLELDPDHPEAAAARAMLDGL